MDPINPTNQTNNADAATAAAASSAPAPQSPQPASGSEPSPSPSRQTAPGQLVVDAEPELTQQQVEDLEDQALNEIATTYAADLPNLKPAGTPPKPQRPQQPARAAQQQQPTRQQPQPGRQQPRPQPQQQQTTQRRDTIEGTDGAGNDQPDEQLLADDSTIAGEGADDSLQDTLDGDGATVDGQQADDQLTPIEWTDDELNLLQAFDVDPGDKTLNAMSETQREIFLEGLAARAEATARHLGNDAQRAQGQQTQQADQPVGKHWEAFTSEFGETATKAARQAMAAEFNTLLSPVQQRHSVLASMLEDVHFETGLSRLKDVPSGIDLNNPTIRAKLKTEATRLVRAEQQRLGRRFSFKNFNLLHALPRAAAIVFQPQQSAAARSRRAEQTQRSIRGSAEPATRRPSTRPVRTEDDAIDAAAEAAARGVSLAEIERAYAGQA
jgi:hypothetical protein